ncbi:MAG: nucleotidyl transferase, partial [Armatimonadota bacterium]|nr:nucleotidyl transferase [Armatimonadota bacterium]
RLRYSVEEGPLLGTAGAIKQAEPLLHDRFFLMYGDSYLQYDYADVMEKSQIWPALMVVYRNEDRYDNSNVAVNGNRVVRYAKGLPTGELEYIDAGLSVLTREALKQIPAGEPSSLDAILFPKLADNCQLGAFISTKRFYEIGSPPGLEEFSQLMKDLKSFQ